MDSNNNAPNYTVHDELPVSDLLLAIDAAGRATRRSWLLILLAGLGLGMATFCYALLTKPTYTAICTFVLDDSGNSSLGAYSGLASLAGINLGGGEGAFQGDNIFGLYKSRLMIEKTLMSYGEFDGKKQRLIDYYLDFTGLRKKETPEELKAYVSFNTDPQHFSRAQDSVVDYIWDLFNHNYLYVSKQDKRLSIYQVEFSSKDELFTQQFTQQLVDNVNAFYLQTKTEKASQNVAVLQHEADSVKALLNTSFSRVALAEEANPNPNPALQSLRVPAIKRQVDQQSAAAIYAEVVKNLEVAKVSLRQESPLIQIIDRPLLPLESNHKSKWKWAALGLVMGLLATAATIFTIAVYRRLSIQSE